MEGNTLLKKRASAILSDQQLLVI